MYWIFFLAKGYIILSVLAFLYKFSLAYTSIFNSSCFHIINKGILTLNLQLI